MTIAWHIDVSSIVCTIYDFNIFLTVYCLYSYPKQQIGQSDCHITANCGKKNKLLLTLFWQPHNSP